MGDLRRRRSEVPVFWGPREGKSCDGVQLAGFQRADGTLYDLAISVDADGPLDVAPRSDWLRTSLRRSQICAAWHPEPTRYLESGCSQSQGGDRTVDGRIIEL